MIDERRRETAATQRGKSYPVPATARGGAYRGVNASFMGLPEGLYAVFFRAASRGLSGVQASLSYGIGNASAESSEIIFDVGPTTCVVVPARDVTIHLFATLREGYPAPTSDDVDVMAVPVTSKATTSPTFAGRRVSALAGGPAVSLGAVPRASSSLTLCLPDQASALPAGAQLVVVQTTAAGLVVQSDVVTAGGYTPAPVAVHPWADQAQVTNNGAVALVVAPLWTLTL